MIVLVYNYVYTYPYKIINKCINLKNAALFIFSEKKCAYLYTYY